MSTKSCPFCGKDISDEAIICKFCHRLLIDENGKDISSAPEIEETQPAQTAEEKTIVYSKDELKKALDEAASQQEEYADDEQQDNSAEEYEYEQEYSDENAAYDDYGDGYDEGEYTYDEQSDVYAENYDEGYEEQPRYRSAARDRVEAIPAAEQDPKRTFIITIIVTLGILLILIAAIVVGYKLFGFDDEDASSSQITNTTPAPAETLPPETQSSETEYVPQVTDDTISESPEETSNSDLADPVVTSDSMVVVPGDSSSSSADSSSSSSADSSSETDSSSSQDSTSETDSTVNDGPEGSYYTWDEAFGIIENYFSSNGMNGTFDYAYGEENSSMSFQYYDESGNPAGIYTVDLYTGQVYAS